MHGVRTPFRRLALAAATGLLFVATGAYAATFGHSRIISHAGEPLVVQVPVSGLTQQDIQTLSAQVAPEADWKQAGLVPPVDLGSLSIQVEPGMQPAARVLRVQSTEAFTGGLADLLLDVQTASGRQRYQVTLITGAGRAAPVEPASSSATTPAGQSAVGTSAQHAVQPSIAVRHGDTMFAVARRHAVEGVTVYQMMMALQRANPQAFIEHNVNLVRAGARLVVPDMDELLALSDREARREFAAQAAAFAAYRNRGHGAQAVSAAPQNETAAAQGAVSSESAATPAQPEAQGDHLRLSDATPAGSGEAGALSAQAGIGGQTGEQGQAGTEAQADLRTAQGKAIADAQGRVSQLEENVGHISQALKAQGEAARTAVVEGAKGLSESISTVADAVSQASHDAVAQSGDSDAAAAGNGAMGAAGASASLGAPGTVTDPAVTDPAVTDPTATDSAATDSAATDPAAADGAAGSQAAIEAMTQPTSEAKKTVPWIQDHLLGIIIGLLAVIVLFIAWLLKRAGSARDDVHGGAQVTEAMVRERLANIDLDLTPEAGKADKTGG
ncbi:MAG: hypothetical protein L0H54_00120 [Alcaligenaceae bacterium]|nr:hypothetical protein [Alcaligenaceae bacterium]